MQDDFQSERIGQRHGPTLKFRGRVIDELDRPRSTLHGDRWFGGVLWETEGGAWIADSIHYSDADGEDDHHRALVLKPDMDDQERCFAVMEHFGWSAQARAMAKRLKWNLALTID